MPRDELAHLELLAEVDTLVDRLNRWADSAPAWQPAEKCAALVRRLTERAAGLRVRLEAPLVVAMLGGTGTGKSALLNALVGMELVQTGRSRPTTMRPTLVCRPDLTPEMLGIDADSVELVRRDLPALRDLVLVDCPDPDTTEEDAAVQPNTATSSLLDSNLARLRAILPKCDVLLVTATQQKYRSARVTDELALAAHGARVVFVQTHADVDADIRDDWRKVLDAELTVSHANDVELGATAGLSTMALGATAGLCSSAVDMGGQALRGTREASSGKPLGQSGSAAGAKLGAPVERASVETSQAAALTLALAQRERGLNRETLAQRERGHDEIGHIFRVDSLRALADSQADMQPRGEFAELLDLLTRQMAGAAATRIRRANFLDLATDTLDACRERIDEALPTVRQLQTAIGEERTLLAQQLAGQMQAELLTNRRQWENRLLSRTASRWGLSPFALVLRVYQGIGGLLSGALLYRARTPAQMALWGAMEGARTRRNRRKESQAQRGVSRATAGGFDPAELRKAALIVDGYAGEAGIEDRPQRRSRSAANAGITAFDEVSAEANAAAAGFVARVSGELETLITRLAQRHAGWFTRFCYEFLLLAMLGLLLYRLGKNFFYDSWLAEPRQAVFGLEFYLAAMFWLALWCLLLLWFFCRRLRRGLRSEITQLATGWQDGSAAAGILRDWRAIAAASANSAKSWMSSAAT